MTRWTLDRLSDGEALADRLQAAGLPPRAVAEKAELFRQAATALLAKVGLREATAYAWFVPGRIEVLGKHTDYAGGRSLVAATTQGFCAIAVPRPDLHVCAIEARRQQAAEFALSTEIVASAGHWSSYPMTVARRLARNFGCTRGADLAFASDLPRAAGMSSSSALMIAVLALLADVNDLEPIGRTSAIDLISRVTRPRSRTATHFAT